MATAAQNVDIKEEDVWEIVSDDTSTVALEEGTPADANAENSAPVEASGNPIGELQELCVSKGWAMPSYEEGPRTGPPHLPTFVITCKLNEMSYSASATSKRQAKKAAAAGMLAKVNAGEISSTVQTQTATCMPKALTEIENTLNQLTITADDNYLELMTAADIEKLLSTLARRSDVVLTSRAGSDIEGRSIWICEIDGRTVTGYGKTPHEARIDAAKGVTHQLRMKILSQK